jgi:hypothetical protein
MVEYFPALSVANNVCVYDDVEGFFVVSGVADAEVVALRLIRCAVITFITVAASGIDQPITPSRDLPEYVPVLEQFTACQWQSTQFRLHEPASGYTDYGHRRLPGS